MTPLRRCLLTARAERQPLVWATVLFFGLALAVPGKASAAGGAGLTTPHATAHRFAVGEIVVSYSDPSRRMRLPDGRSVARRLTTVIRYPASGDPSRVDILAAPAAKQDGPFPVVVFGHGFAVMPAIYTRLLRAWAAAGFVVAAPIFPLSNEYAPSGPDESDLVNQPTDMSFVITRMLAANAAPKGILARLIEAHEIAVAGQSDGGSTALAAAYNQHFADRRIGAAIILSGARIPGLSGYEFTAASPPLLAVQGTGDDVNVPNSTYEYYGLARAPKFLLSLLGAPHLPPYTTEQPQLGIVEHVSIAFLDRYLEHEPGARTKMWKAANVPNISTLAAGY
jgi:fermentation-respiration switch protein FrsA (DUF1100 family)